MKGNDVLNKLVETLAANRERIGVMSQYAGGWEGWLQCELSLKWEPGDVEREVALWNDRRACDLWFPATQFCVELKCFSLNRAHKAGAAPRHFSDIGSSYAGWSQDILKDSAKLEALPDGYLGVSIVVIPTWLPQDILVILKEQLSKVTYQWMEREGFFIGLRKKGWL
jgi:hypothetical protein